MATVFIIERDNKASRFMAWRLRQAGHAVVSSFGGDELVTGERVQPDVIVFNTSMPMEVKRLWVSSLRYIVPDVDVIDLCTTTDLATYDTGADGYLRAPYRVDALVALMEELRAQRELAAAPTSSEVPS